ncbi:MAG: hypothetical protein GY714_23520 [Desulfobacterales bacterium]|nr:hypothetical protein [Desulfobacterales bacterium]
MKKDEKKKASAELSESKLPEVIDVNDNEIPFDAFYFSRDTIGIKAKKTNRPRKFKREAVRKMVISPHENKSQLQQVSQSLYSSSGNYLRILNNLYQMLTFDHYIMPDNNKNTDDYFKEFESAAKYIDRYNLKYNCRWILKKLLIDGEVYLYKIDDGKNIVYTNFPTDYCRVAEERDNVLRYEIDLNKIASDEIKEYPQEIKDAWNEDTKRRNSKTTKSQLDTNRSSVLNNNGDWYLVSEKGVAFNVLGMQMNGYPYLSFVFDEIMKVEDTKDESESNNRTNNFKLIHNKVPLDKENKMPVIPEPIQRIYHEETKKNTPENVGVSTNPFDVEAILLQNKDTNSFNIVSNTEKELWNTSGFNQNLFNGDKSTGEAIKKSIITDEQLMYEFLKMFENYFNDELKLKKWKVRILEVTNFNRDDKIKQARENLAYGGNRMEWIALNGETPYEFIKRAKFEQLIGIDNFLPIKLTSHTANGDSQPGAPKSNNPSENTEIDRDKK